MSFWELFILVGTMATIFGMFVTSYAIINGRNTRKILREEAEYTRQILIRIEQNQNETRKEIAEARREIAEAITEARKEMAEARKEMAEARREIAEAITEARKEMAEARKEMAEARKEMAEAIKYLANLIVSEAEKTRQVLRTQP